MLFFFCLHFESISKIISGPILLINEINFIDFHKIVDLLLFAIELGFYFLILHPLFPKAGLLESGGKAEEHDHAVTDLCTVLDGLLVAVAIQR